MDTSDDHKSLKKKGSEHCLVGLDDPTPNVKMCGRDLIRLAVSYCGNPRNRRSLPDADLDQHKTLCEPLCSPFTEVSVVTTLHLQSDGEKPPPRTAPRWFSRSFRIRRAAKKVSDICCEEGCSMKELIQFC
uniref:Insulin-like 3 n=1 Tax=Oryzias sinensis TaxID=183150 RepID=A0A8C7X507_9TELE